MCADAHTRGGGRLIIRTVPTRTALLPPADRCDGAERFGSTPLASRSALMMFRDLSTEYVESPASGSVETMKPRSPVCPECHSSLNRIRRRFIDRVLCFFYPVHRYHCRSFVCNWEGNLRYTSELGRWEALHSYRAEPAGTVYQADEQAAATRAKPNVAETGPRESDTLPRLATRPPKHRKPDVRADSRTATNVPRRANSAPP